MKRRVLAGETLGFILLCWSLVFAGCAGGGVNIPDGGARDGGADVSPDGGGEGLAVTSVTPGIGPVEGGTTVVVSGRGFESGATVLFGTNQGQQPLLLSAYQIKVTTPPAQGPGKVAVTVRLPSGASASLPDAFEYSQPQPNGVDWCALQWPKTTTTKPGVATEPIFGQIWEKGCTDGAAKCTGVRAELGYGQPGVDPSKNPSAFTWTTATYNEGHTSDDNDEYMATLSVSTEGTYAYAFRFSLDSGATWTYCDLDGSGNGLQTDQLGTLTVATSAQTIGWCKLQWPPTLTSQPGVASDPVYGQVFVDGCTSGAAQCQGVKAQLGYGPVALDPTTDPSVFTWVDATYNPAHAGDDNDEYAATITASTEGAYGYAFRFSINDGNTWTYCDLDGTDNGFQVTQMGRLTVGAPRVDWCITQYPASTSTVPGVATEPIYGQVYVAGCTDGAATCAGIAAQLGRGPQGVNPQLLPDSFVWVDATFNAAHTNDNNDEYQATITVTSSGTYSYAYRFSRDYGSTWTYCDLDGSGNGLQTDRLGTLTVASRTIGWCNVQYPASITIAAGSSTGDIYGQVYVEGCTDGTQRCTGLLAQLGYGPASADPSQDPGSFVWTDASYNTGHTNDNNDEYIASVVVAAAGTYGYAFRFSGDGGSTWTYCDRDGTDNGFQPAQMGQLTVQ